MTNHEEMARFLGVLSGRMLASAFVESATSRIFQVAPYGQDGIRGSIEVEIKTRHVFNPPRRRVCEYSMTDIHTVSHLELAQSFMNDCLEVA